MRPNPQFPADLVTFTEEIFDGKLHFLFIVKGNEKDVLPVLPKAKEISKIHSFSGQALGTSIFPWSHWLMVY